MIKKTLCLCLCLLSTYAHAETISNKGFSLTGDTKYKNFKYFDYVNPNAPKRGHITLPAMGRYDSLNPLDIRHTPAAGLWLLYDTLSVCSEDEPLSGYGLLAERIQRDSNHSFVIFHLNKNARFHDGSEVSAFDVEFSFQTILESKHPFYQFYYEDIANVVVVDKWTIRFNFKNNVHKELPLLLGQMPIFPQKAYQKQKFGENPLSIPLGSGPYRIESIDEEGTKITYTLAQNYWAKNHPVRIGQYNFEKITFQYTKDDLSALKAFQAGVYDYREELNARNWKNGYSHTLQQNELIQKVDLRHSLPSGMQGFFFNTRREIFSDILVREALGYAFDFEWYNEHIFFSQYTRTKSFFENSPLASFGIPLDKERHLLEPYKDSLPQALFEKPFTLPTNATKEDTARNLKQAAQLLEEAGWKKIKGKLYKDGQAFSFTLLVDSVEKQRLSLQFQKRLAQLGIDMKIYSVNTKRYRDLIKKFDYDMIIAHVPQSLSPGSEQRFYFSSQSADKEGSGNYAGIRNAIVDQLVENIIHASNHEALVDNVRALDRVLLWQHYVIPHFYSRSFRIAYWNRFSRPDIAPLYGTGFWSWWIDEDKEQQLIQKKTKLKGGGS